MQMISSIVPTDANSHLQPGGGGSFSSTYQPSLVKTTTKLFTETFYTLLQFHFSKGSLSFIDQEKSRINCKIFTIYLTSSFCFCPHFPPAFNCSFFSKRNIYIYTQFCQWGEMVQTKQFYQHRKIYRNLNQSIVYYQEQGSHENNPKESRRWKYFFLQTKTDQCH